MQEPPSPCRPPASDLELELAAIHAHAASDDTSRKDRPVARLVRSMSVPVISLNDPPELESEPHSATPRATSTDTLEQFTSAPSVFRSHWSIRRDSVRGASIGPDLIRLSSANGRTGRDSGGTTESAVATIAVLARRKSEVCSALELEGLLELPSKPRTHLRIERGFRRPFLPGLRTAKGSVQTLTPEEIRFYQAQRVMLSRAFEGGFMEAAATQQRGTVMPREGDGLAPMVTVDVDGAALATVSRRLGALDDPMPTLTDTSAAAVIRGLIRKGTRIVGADASREVAAGVSRGVAAAEVRTPASSLETLQRSLAARPQYATDALAFPRSSTSIDDAVAAVADPHHSGVVSPPPPSSAAHSLSNTLNLQWSGPSQSRAQSGLLAASKARPQPQTTSTVLGSVRSLRSDPRPALSRSRTASDLHVTATASSVAAATHTRVARGASPTASSNSHIQRAQGSRARASTSTGSPPVFRPIAGASGAAIATVTATHFRAHKPDGSISSKSVSRLSPVPTSQSSSAVAAGQDCSQSDISERLSDDAEGGGQAKTTSVAASSTPRSAVPHKQQRTPRPPAVATSSLSARGPSKRNAGSKPPVAACEGAVVDVGGIRPRTASSPVAPAAAAAQPTRTTNVERNSATGRSSPANAVANGDNKSSRTSARQLTFSTSTSSESLAMRHRVKVVLYNLQCSLTSPKSKLCVSLIQSVRACVCLTSAHAAHADRCLRQLTEFRCLAHVSPGRGRLPW